MTIACACSRCVSTPAASAGKPQRAAAGVIALVRLHANDPKVMTTITELRKDPKLNIDLRRLIEIGEEQLRKPAPVPMK